MVQKYQNEIPPIFYYGISTKTNEKDLKIPNLQPPDWKHPYWMTLYNIIEQDKLRNADILVQQETIRTNSSSQVTTQSLFDLHEIYNIMLMSFWTGS